MHKERHVEICVACAIPKPTTDDTTSHTIYYSPQKP
jgi:hypothetical protein